MSFCWCDAIVWLQQKVSMNAEISKEEEMIVWNRVDKTFIWPSSRFLYLYFGTKCLLYQLTKGLNNINVVRDSQLADWIKKMLRLFMKSEELGWELLLCIQTYTQFFIEYFAQNVIFHVKRHVKANISFEDY